MFVTWGASTVREYGMRVQSMRLGAYESSIWVCLRLLVQEIAGHYIVARYRGGGGWGGCLGSEGCCRMLT
jgi:hypothetical protein